MANPFDLIDARLTNIETLLLDIKHGEGAPAKETNKKYVYGLGGLARLIGCSHPTAQRLKNSGQVPFTQAGRKIVFDADAVLTALNKKGGNK